MIEDREIMACDSFRIAYRAAAPPFLYQPILVFGLDRIEGIVWVAVRPEPE
jgi:hypothetical protein